MKTEARFEVGQLVRHRRYEYRGVVFGFDDRCEAGETWYQSNQTQPDRGQHWYHIMVDGATHTTYVAESNLLPEEDDLSPVAHPMLKSVFQGFHGGRYHHENLN